MKILVTGFEPFGQHSLNASWEAVRLLPDAMEGCDVVRAMLPVSFCCAPKEIWRLIKRHNPDIVVCVGQTALSDKVKLERVALNMMDASGCDNDGCAPREKTAYDGAPTAFITPFPLRDITDELKAMGQPVVLSNTAGTYVCNRVYYETLYRHRHALFVHVPLVDAQGGSLSAADEAGILEMIIKKLLEYEKDSNTTDAFDNPVAVGAGY